MDSSSAVLAAHRDADSVVFGPAFAELAQQYPDRLVIREHLDSDAGFVTALGIRAFIEGSTDGDFYVFIERFAPAVSDPVAAPPVEPEWEDGTVTIVMSGKQDTVPQHGGETLLESARRAGLTPPFSCEAGNCATCIAQVVVGKATMRANNALDDDEVADGWILTCQGEPAAQHVTVVYED
jgi:ferredoxin